MYSIDRLQSKYRILPSKINRPPLPKGHVPRARLVSLLNLAQTKRCVVLLAPAGFGKSTLLAEWANQANQSTLWYSLDELDNELSRFCSYLFVAVRKQFPQLHSQFFEQEENLNAANRDTIVRHLVQLLAAIPWPTALILDDCQTITNPIIWQIIEQTLAQLPSHLCWVLGSRSKSPIGLSRLQKAGQIQEFDILDIKFSPLETEQFLLKNLPQYSLEQSQQLINTEISGWIAGLQLSLISHNQYRLRPVVAPGVNLQSQRLMQDYLIEEVLKHTDKRTLAFLFATVICRRFSVDLANELTAGQDADLVIDQLQRDQLFILPEGTAEPWYRYHSMFRHSLLAIANGKTPKAISALHLKAAQWWVDRQYYSEAAEHLVSSGDGLALQGFLHQYGWLLYHSNQLRTLQQCFGGLARATIINDAPLTLLFCWTVVHEQQHDLARECLATARAQGLQDMAEIGSLYTLDALLALLNGDTELSLEWVQLALPMLGDDLYWERVHCLLIRAEVLQSQGHYFASIDSAEQAVGICAARQFQTQRAQSHYLIAQAHMAVGDFNATALALDQALAIADIGGLSRLFTRQTLIHCQARLLLARAQYSAAVILLDPLDGSLHEVGAAWHLPLVTQRLKLQLILDTDPRTVAQTAEQLVQARTADCPKTPWIAEADEAMLLYQAKTSAAQPARQTDSRLAALTNTSAGLAQDLNRILTAAATDSVRSSTVRDIGKLLVRCECLEAKLPALKLRLLLAICLTQLGQTQPAKEALLIALSSNGPEMNIGLIECYKNTLGLPLLLDEDLADHTPLATLLFLTRQTHTELIRQQLTERIALLTPKEWSVLALLAERRKNEEIAASLAIAPTTVRSHMKNINRKLQVSSRDQAIVQAQRAQRLRKIR